MKKLFLALFVSVLVLGCEKEDSESENLELVGVWNLVHAEYKQFEAGELIWEDVDTPDNLVQYFKFSSDGSFEYYSKYVGGDDADIVSGKYTLDGNNLVLSEGDMEVVFDYQINREEELVLYNEYTMEGYDYEATTVYAKE